MTLPSRPLVANPTAAALLSLAPWAAFLLALQFWPGDADPSNRGTIAVAPISLFFVALPASVPIVVSRVWLVRLGAVVVMTAATVFAAAAIITSDDAQAGLAVLWVPIVAVPLAAVIWIGQLIVERRSTPDTQPHGGRPAPAATSHRLAAVVIDMALAAAVLFVPLTALSRGGQEVVAVVVGLAAATSFLALPIALRGGTIGHSLIGLTVVDAATLGRVGIPRAYVRSFLVVVEATFIYTLLPLIDFATLAASGRSLPDRFLRTSVVSTR